MQWMGCFSQTTLRWRGCVALLCGEGGRQAARLSDSDWGGGGRQNYSHCNSKFPQSKCTAIISDFLLSHPRQSSNGFNYTCYNSIRMRLNSFHWLGGRANKFPFVARTMMRLQCANDLHRSTMWRGWTRVCCQSHTVYDDRCSRRLVCCITMIYKQLTFSRFVDALIGLSAILFISSIKWTPRASLFR